MSDAESFRIQPSQHFDAQTSNAIISYNQPLVISDDDLRQSVRLLNTKQRRAYDKLLSWCRNKVKNRSAMHTWGLMRNSIPFGWNAVLKHQHLGVDLLQVKR